MNIQAQTLAEKLISQFEESDNVSELVGCMGEVNAETTSDDLMVIGFEDGSSIYYNFGSGWHIG